MNSEYDDWFLDNAPCSTESSRTSLWPSSLFWKRALNAALLRWTLIWTVIALFVVVLAFASGCGNKTVLVSEDSVIRVGPRVSGAIYYRLDGEWRESAQKIEYPEGWYLVPPSFVEENAP